MKEATLGDWETRGYEDGRKGNVRTHFKEISIAFGYAAGNSYGVGFAKAEAERAERKEKYAAEQLMKARGWM